MAEPPPLTIEQATALLREKTGKPVTVRSVRDVSARFVVLRQRVETRMVETRQAPEPTTPALSTPARDLIAELWSLDAQDNGEDTHVVIVEDPRTGALRPCADCEGRGQRSCPHCRGNAVVHFASDSREFNALRPSACRSCFGGTVPCERCSTRGSLYTVQSARIAWSHRERRTIVRWPLPTIDIDSAPAERVGEVEFDGDVPRPIAGGSMDHFRASAGRDEDLRAIATLAAAHSAAPSERVLSQRASVERISIWEVVCDPDVIVHLVGPDRQLRGEHALRASPSHTVALVALVLGVVAIFAGSVLR